MSFRWRRTSRGAGPPAATAGRAATSSCEPIATSRPARVPGPSARLPRPGTHGSSKRRTGAAGEDLVVTVPEGTVKARDGAAVADLISHGDSYLAARRSRRSRNARFLSNARRAPSFAEQGEYGEEEWFRLELRPDGRRRPRGLPELGEVDADLDRRAA